MNILYALNDKYVPQTAASILSLCENNKDVDEINFYMISYQIANKNKKELVKMIKKYKRTINFIEIEDLNKYIDFEFDTTGWPQITLARLLMDKLLPNSIDRILYLDGDTIVRGSLIELWNTNLDNQILAASIEPTISQKRKELLNLERYPYCNAGVLLVNLNKWREKEAGKLIFDYYKSYDGKLFANDQDAINGALKKYIKVVSPKYNYYNIFDQYPYRFLQKIMKPVEYLPKDVIKDAKKKPIIIHYLGEERPWRKGNTHRFRKEFKYYLGKTNWKDMPEEEGWSVYFICWKVFNIITKPFPGLRLKVINSLIPSFLKYRSKKIKKEGLK